MNSWPGPSITQSKPKASRRNIVTIREVLARTVTGKADNRASGIIHQLLNRSTKTNDSIRKLMQRKVKPAQEASIMMSLAGW